MIGTHTFTLGVPKDYTPGSRKRKVAGTTVGTPLTITFAKTVTALLLACVVPGCAHHCVNAPLKTQDPQAGYRSETTPHAGNSDELFVILAFSGGGTRAAALSYGALAELRDTTLTIGGRKRRLLDERELAPREFTDATAGKSYIDGTPKKKPTLHPSARRRAVRQHRPARPRLRHDFGAKPLEHEAAAQHEDQTPRRHHGACEDRLAQSVGSQKECAGSARHALRRHDETVPYLSDYFASSRKNQTIAKEFSELTGGSAPKLNKAELYHIEVNFQNVKDQAEREYLRRGGTNFSLPGKAIDRLRATAAAQIREAGDMARLHEAFGR